MRRPCKSLLIFLLWKLNKSNKNTWEKDLSPFQQDLEKSINWTPNTDKYRILMYNITVTIDLQNAINIPNLTKYHISADSTLNLIKTY